MSEADDLLREAYGCLRTLLVAADVLDMSEPTHAAMASAIESDMLATFRRIEHYLAQPTEGDDE